MEFLSGESAATGARVRLCSLCCLARNGTDHTPERLPNTSPVAGTNGGSGLLQGQSASLVLELAIITFEQTSEERTLARI